MTLDFFSRGKLLSNKPTAFASSLRSFFFEMAEFFNQQKDKRIGCKKCGFPGHLTYQCRNLIKVSFTLFKNLSKIIFTPA